MEVEMVALEEGTCPPCRHPCLLWDLERGPLHHAWVWAHSWSSSVLSSSAEMIGHRLLQRLHRHLGAWGSLSSLGVGVVEVLPNSFPVQLPPGVGVGMVLPDQVQLLPIRLHLDLVEEAVEASPMELAILALVVLVLHLELLLGSF